MSSGDISSETVIGLTAVIVAVTDETPRVLVARRIHHDLATPAQQGRSAAPQDRPDTLPYGPFDAQRHRTLELGLRGWVEEQTGIRPRYVEQLYTFGNQYRDPREFEGGPRVVSIAYLALTHETPLAGTGEARWRDWYDCLPWEDWRGGRPAIVDKIVRPALQNWIRAAPDRPAREERRERVSVAFGFDKSAPVDYVRCLERYELLYEAGLVLEALRDRLAIERAQGRKPSAIDSKASAAAQATGAPMALDNRRILASALGRLRGKLAYRPVIFDLLPEEFTLLRMQRVVEALSGRRLHKQNFRRMVLNADLVESTGHRDTTSPGRPAELFRFRREVVTERAAVGVGLPALSAAE